jgi:hypothetical protein
MVATTTASPTTAPLARFRERVQLMLKAGKGKLGHAQQKVLDKEQRELGLSAVEAAAVIQDLLGGNSAQNQQDYAIFLLSLYNDGSGDLAAMSTELEAERTRLQLSSEVTAQLEKAVVDYFDYYRALVTSIEVEEWARTELQNKQQELKLSNEIAAAIEEHIRSL